MKKTYEEILEIFQANMSIEEFAFNDFPEEWYPAAGQNWEHPNYMHPELGYFEEIEQVGGEGEGDHWHSIKYFKDQDIYICVTGFYSSYNGTDFYGGFVDCCSNVRPTQKTITVYE
jgi:hypothetical protein